MILISPKNVYVDAKEDVLSVREIFVFALSSTLTYIYLYMKKIHTTVSFICRSKVIATKSYKRYNKIFATLIIVDVEILHEF